MCVFFTLFAPFTLFALKGPGCQFHIHHIILAACFRHHIAFSGNIFKKDALLILRSLILLTVSGVTLVKPGAPYLLSWCPDDTVI